jgi:hypothetical protein
MAFSICDCVYLSVAPAARASTRLFFPPPFPPDAERCALMCVESIICVCVDLPRSATSQNSLSHAASWPALSFALDLNPRGYPGGALGMLYCGVLPRNPIKVRHLGTQQIMNFRI